MAKGHRSQIKRLTNEINDTTTKPTLTKPTNTET